MSEDKQEVLPVVKPKKEKEPSDKLKQAIKAGATKQAKILAKREGIKLKK